MLLLIIIILGVACFVLLNRSRPVSRTPEQRLEVGERLAGSTTNGVVLGYLVSNFLIDSHQYKEWSGLEAEDLRGALATAGIMTAAEFDILSQQIAAGGELYAVPEQYQGGA